MRTASWSQSVSVLDRLSAVLDAFGNDGEGMTVTQLAHRANLPKSTVSRIAAELVDEGYLDRDGAMLYLGIRLFEFGQSVEHPRRLRDLARPAMKSLRDIAGHSVQLAVADDDTIIVIASTHGRGEHPPARVGERLRRESTALGDAFDGAHGGEGDAAAPHVRVHGAHACIASPVLERQVTIAAVSISGPTAELDIAVLAPLVRSSATAISRRVADAP